jgi:hypothetical protein
LKGDPMKGLILICALFACFLFTSSASAECSGGVCSFAGRPVLRAVAAPVRAVQFVRANKPVRSFAASRPLARLVAARPVRSLLFGR